MFHLHFSNQIEFDLKSINQEFPLLLKEFLNNDWRKGGLRHLIRKIYKTKDFARILGSGRTPTALTNENVEEVEELSLSQEGKINKWVCK